MAQADDRVFQNQFFSGRADVAQCAEHGHGQPSCVGQIGQTQGQIVGVVRIWIEKYEP